jgi:hypothetical protein
MKVRIWQIIIITTILFVSCEKKVTGVNASIMEFGTTDECAYILILDETLDGEKRFVPTNLPEEFKTYTLPNIEVSFKNTGEYCECEWTRGASPDGEFPPKYILEKVEIKDIEFK